MDKKKRFSAIARDIKSVKIQGARNIAKSALEAYSFFPDEKHKKILLSLRPTEPMLRNTLNFVEKISKNEILKHFNEAQNKINQNVIKIIKNNSIIFTHCHSTNVTNSLIFAKEHRKKFEVFNTETRPLNQGRKTARELSKHRIKVTFITDLEINRFIKNTDAVFLGADAILKNGDVINKIGSGMISELAFNHKIPVYIIADSWKFSKKDVKIEERNYKEIWKNAPKHIKIINLAFEKIPSKYITAIISEKGILSPKQFVKKMN